MREANAPIFVLGNRRSGTTMLRLMLTSHPHITIPPEGGFIVRLGWRYGRKGLRNASELRQFVDDLFAQDNTRDWQLDREALEARLRNGLPSAWPDVVNAVYAEYAERTGGGALRWGDKTTWYHGYLPQIDSYFPTARYVHILRDPRGVLASFRDVDHLPDDPVAVGVEWAETIGLIRRHGTRVGPDRYLEVLYEDLVNRPEEQLHRITEFLGESFHPGMLEFGRKNRQETLEPKRHLGWKALTLEAVQPRRADRWLERLDGGARAELALVTGAVDVPYGSDRPDIPLGRAALIHLRAAVLRRRARLARHIRPVRARLLESER